MVLTQRHGERITGPVYTDSVETVEKPSGFFRQKDLQSAARIICPPQTDKFHTGSLSGIFSHAHVARENDFISLPPAGGKLCEAFLIRCAEPVYTGSVMTSAIGKQNAARNEPHPIC